MGLFQAPLSHLEADAADPDTVIVLGAPESLDSPTGPLSVLVPGASLVGDGALVEQLVRERGSSLAPAALAPLREIDALLASARVSMADLDEHAALVRLAQAERLAQNALALPSAAAFYAEVELQLAITAAQAGLGPLAEESLRRAARLSPSRKLLPGEASPDLVALAARIWNEAGSAPLGEVPIEVDPPGARVFLDDLDLGPAPVIVRTSVGEHALRFTAPGMIGYGMRLEVAQGRRAMQRVALAPDAVSRALSLLHRAGERGDLAQLRAGLAELATEEPRYTRALAVFARADRAVVLSCTSQLCTGPARLQRRVWLSGLSQEPIDAPALADARAWLDASPAAASATGSLADQRPSERPAFWGRWYVWSGLALLGAGAGTLIAALATPAPERKLRVIVNDPASP